MKSIPTFRQSNGSVPVHRLMAFALTLTLACTSTLAGGWKRHNTTGPRPSERSTPALGAVGEQVYVFGGVFDNFIAGTDTFYNDLYRFNTETDSWSLLTPTGAVPSARAFAASAAQPSTGRFFVFGGASYGPGFSDFTVYDDLWAYNTAGNVWTQIQATNPGPSGRSRPAAWMQGNRLYVFGGINGYFSTLNDLWVYNTDSNTWTELIPDGAAGSPPSRHEAMLGARPQGGRLVLYGGETLGEFGFETLGDTWEYNLAQNRWEDRTPAAPLNIDPPRNFAGAGLLQGNLYLHGGDIPGGTDCCGAPFPQNVSSDLWRFDRQSGNWTEISGEVGAAPRIKRHRGVEMDNRLYLFSGYDFVDGVGQVWNLDVYSFKP